MSNEAQRPGVVGFALGGSCPPGLPASCGCARDSLLHLIVTGLGLADGLKEKKVASSSSSIHIHIHITHGSLY